MKSLIGYFLLAICIILNMIAAGLFIYVEVTDVRGGFFASKKMEEPVPDVGWEVIKYDWEVDTVCYKLSNNLLLLTKPQLDTVELKEKVIDTILDFFFEENRRLFGAALEEKAKSNPYIGILMGELNTYFYVDIREIYAFYTIDFKGDYLQISFARSVLKEEFRVGSIE